MSLELRKLSAEDGRDIYEMLQEMPSDENGFINPVNGKTYDTYREWLRGSVEDEMRSGIVDGWKVPSTTFWLYENGRPAGFGKIRHFLTDALREHGGHIGYAIRPDARNRGLGKTFLSLLLDEGQKIGISSFLLTIQNDNLPSIRIALANGGKIEKTTADQHYIWIER